MNGKQLIVERVQLKPCRQLLQPQKSHEITLKFRVALCYFVVSIEKYSTNNIVGTLTKI